MNAARFIPLFLCLFIPLLIGNREEKYIKQYLELKENRRNGDNEMKELAERLQGKEVIINVLSQNPVECLLKEVTDNGLVVETFDGSEKMINLDFVITMREYPKNKNGKRKAFVTD